ncbi:MAG: hypothetical protein JNK16_16750 [Phycisphaerales bacterium]|nr:hypothetical protein [Phycisphaerales bacterium]
MHRLVRSIRLAGIVAAACLTLLSGLALVWFFVQPETLPLLSTWQLAAILGAFVLPGLCLGAWQADRQASAHAPRPRPNAVRVAKAVDPVQPSASIPLAPAQVAGTPGMRSGVTQPAPVSSVGRLSPAGRSIHADRSVHRHRRSARV